MAREFFKNLPDQTTPLTAPRLNGLLDGDEPMGNVVVDSIRTKNMFDKNSLINGSINATTGAYTYQNYIVVSDYIWLSAGTYTIKMNNSSNIYLHTSCAYNSSKTYSSTLWGETTNTQRTFTLSADSYVRISFRNTSYSAITPSDVGNTNIQLEKGSTATTYSAYQELNPDVSGLDNGHMTDAAAYGGLAKRSQRANGTTYTIIDPNYQNNGYIRNAMVMCGDSGIMFIRWSGNNATTAGITWSSLTGGKTCTISHSNGVLTFTFSATVYGGINVLFLN